MEQIFQTSRPPSPYWLLLSAAIGVFGAILTQFVAHLLAVRREERQREKLIQREGELLAELKTMRMLLGDIRDAIRRAPPPA